MARAVRWAVPIWVLIVLAITADMMRRGYRADRSTVALLIFVFGLGSLLWFTSGPSVLTVTADGQVLIPDPDSLRRQRIARSELAYIFRGQGHLKGGWFPCYFFVTQDDTPQNMVRGEDFTDEGMTELARRLNVPVKGDFSQQVR